MPTDAQIESYMDEKVRPLVAEYGWMAQSVFPTEDAPDFPYFTYTVGLHGLGHPELVIVGLPPDQSHGILSGLVEKVIEGNETIGPGRRDDVLVGMPVEIRRLSVPEADENLSTARRYASADVDGLQVVWPDKAGLLPSDPGCDPDYVKVQVLPGGSPDMLRAGVS